MSSNNYNKRFKSTVKYVDKLSEDYSKLIIVRVDLSYKKPYSNNITLKEANKHINRMHNNMRSKPSIFRDMVGYVFKKEFTKDKGVHLHAIFIFDGQKVQKDAFKGDEIGKYWVEQITKGQGSFHNCNRNDYKQKGIGMLDHRDSEKRKILNDEVISYLCKNEQDIGVLKTSKRAKAFTRGVMPNGKRNKGSPRL